MALNDAFGDGYKIYQNDVEQGLKEPCFLIAVLRPERAPLPGGRTLMREPLDIHYFPTEPRNSAEMIAAAETMLQALDVIVLPDGDLIRGTSMRYEIVDNVLHFFVNFDHIILRRRGEPLMETLEVETGTTETEER